MRLVEKKNIIPKYQKSGKFIEPFTEQSNLSYGVNNMSDEQIDLLNNWLYNMRNNLNLSVSDFNTNADNVTQGRKMQINSGLYNYLTKLMVEAGNKAAKETYGKEVIDYYLNNNDDDSRLAISGWKASNNARANALLPYAKLLDYLSGTKDTYLNNVLKQRDYTNKSIDNGVLLSTILPATALTAIYKGPSVLRHLKNFTKDVGAALMPTTRAMYSPYTKNIYKGAAKRFGLDLGLGITVDGAAESAGYDWQAMTGLPETIADLTNPLYIMTDRFVDLGPIKVNKLIRKTVKDGVKKGARKVKETVTDLFTPKPTVLPIETYLFGGPFRRVLRKGVEEVVDKVSDKVLDYASRATKGMLDLSEEAMARRAAEIEARKAAIRKELKTDYRVQEAFDKLTSGDIKSGIDEAITRQMKEVSIPDNISTEGHRFSYNDKGNKTSVPIYPEDITGAYNWLLGRDFSEFKEALRKEQRIRPMDGLFNNFTRRYRANPPTKYVNNVPTGTYKDRDIKIKGKVIVGTDSDELPLIFDRGNAQIDHFRWNGLKNNSYISRLTENLGLEALRKGSDGQFHKLLRDESLSSIHELGNEVLALLWNYLSTLLGKPATVDQYFLFVDKLASNPKFRNYLSEVHGGMYLVLPTHGKYLVGAGALQVDSETLNKWLKLFGTAGVIATTLVPSNYVEQQPTYTDIMYKNGGTIKKRFK